MCLTNQFTEYDLKNIPLLYGFYHGFKRFYRNGKYLTAHVMAVAKNYKVGKWLYEKNYRPTDLGIDVIPDSGGGNYPAGWHINIRPYIHPYLDNQGYGRDILFKDIVAIGYDNGTLCVVAKYIFILPIGRDLNSDEIYSLYNHRNGGTVFSMDGVSDAMELFAKEIEIIEFAKSVADKENVSFILGNDSNVFGKPEYKKKTREILNYLSNDLSKYSRYIGFLDEIPRHAREFKAGVALHLYGYRNYKKYRKIYEQVVRDARSHEAGIFNTITSDIRQMFGRRR